jgi:hypothetical protein
LTAEFETFVREEENVELRKKNDLDDGDISSGKKILKNIELSRQKSQDENEVKDEKVIENPSNGDVKMREVKNGSREETPEYIPLTVREKFHVLRIEEDHDVKVKDSRRENLIVRKDENKSEASHIETSVVVAKTSVKEDVIQEKTCIKNESSYTNEAQTPANEVIEKQSQTTEIIRTSSSPEKKVIREETTTIRVESKASPERSVRDKAAEEESPENKSSNYKDKVLNRNKFEEEVEAKEEKAKVELATKDKTTEKDETPEKQSAEKPTAAEEPRKEKILNTESDQNRFITEKVTVSTTIIEKVQSTPEKSFASTVEIEESPENSRETSEEPSQNSSAEKIHEEEIQKLVVNLPPRSPKHSKRNKSTASRDFDESVTNFEIVANQLASPQPQISKEINFRREVEVSNSEPGRQMTVEESSFKNDSGYLSLNTSSFGPEASEEMVIVRTKLSHEEPRAMSLNYQSPVISRESSQVSSFRSTIGNGMPLQKPQIPPKPIVREKTPIPKSYTDSGVSFTRRNFVLMEPQNPPKEFRRSSERDGKVPPTPPPRRRSIKDVIESINRNQQLLKINQTTPIQSRCYDFDQKGTTSPNIDKYQKQQAESEQKINEILEDLQNYTK